MQSTVPGQHHHQQRMIIHIGNRPQPASQWTGAAPRPSTVPFYMHRQSTFVGVVLVVFGILSIVFDIVDLVVWNNDWGIISYGFLGHGIWSGVMCVIAGGFGVGAGRRRSSSGQIRAFLVLCIFAACLSLGQLLIASIGAGSVSYEYNVGDLCCVVSCKNYDFYNHYFPSQDSACRRARTLIAMEAVLAILSFFGGIAAIWGSVLGCRVACCCNCWCCVDECPQLQIAIVENNRVPVTSVTQQQQQQQQGQGRQIPSVHYPAQYPMQCLTNYVRRADTSDEQPGY